MIYCKGFNKICLSQGQESPIEWGDMAAPEGLGGAEECGPGATWAPPPDVPVGSWPLALQGHTKMAFTGRPEILSRMRQGLNKYIRKVGFCNQTRLVQGGGCIWCKEGEAAPFTHRHTQCLVNALLQSLMRGP